MRILSILVVKERALAYLQQALGHLHIYAIYSLFVKTESMKRQPLCSHEKLTRLPTNEIRIFHSILGVFAVGF